MPVVTSPCPETRLAPSHEVVGADTLSQTPFRFTAPKCVVACVQSFGSVVVLRRPSPRRCKFVSLRVHAPLSHPGVRTRSSGLAVRALVRPTVLHLRTDRIDVSHTTVMPFPLVSRRTPRRNDVTLMQSTPSLAWTHSGRLLRANLSWGGIIHYRRTDLGSAFPYLHIVHPPQTHRVFAT